MFEVNGVQFSTDKFAFSIEEVAKRMGYGRETIQAEIDAGRLKTIKLFECQGKVKVSIFALIEWIRINETSSVTNLQFMQR